MALSAAVLSSAIRAGMLAKPATQAQDNPALTAMCDAIAEAVVAHIISAGVVTVTTTVVGVANPGGLAVTGTGTGGGTIS